jgi:hypothetical protein
MPPSQEATPSQPSVPPSQEATPSQPPELPSEQATMPSFEDDQSLNDNEIIGMFITTIEIILLIF